MKNHINIRSIFLVLFCVFVSLPSFAQKKNKVRLKVQYVKVMNGEIYFDIKATSRVNRQNIGVSNATLTIFNEFEDNKIEVGTIITNENGESKFVLENLSAIKADTSGTYSMLISFKGNDKFSKAKKSISFKNAIINAELITKDSLNYIRATLIDATIKEPIVDESLTVQLQRLFMPYPLGEEFNSTDENGTILVNIEEGMPGIDGILTIEVLLDDSDEYGTVKALVNAPIGTPIIDESRFDERTLWSPRTKTPLFLLIFPNLLIFGIWGLIIYLFINLFKITKS